MQSKRQNKKQNQDKKNSFRLGVKYGILVRQLKKIATQEQKQERKVIYADLKHADEELLDYLSVCGAETLEDFKKHVNLWLEMEAKMTNYPKTIYTVGQGENLFKKVGIERELFYRQNAKK